MRYLMSVLLLSCGLVSGCGISQQTKELTAQVIGYNGVSDQYIDVSAAVIANHLAIMNKVKQDQGPDYPLTLVDADGKTFTVPISKYCEALEVLLKFPSEIKKAQHAVNDAVQADRGITAFTEQFLRTLKADRFWEILKGPK